MKKKISIISIITLVVVLSGCSQTSIDTVSDITYLLTGVPGQKHKNAQNKAALEKEQIKKLKIEKSKKEFQNERQSWVGKSIDELTLSWGQGETYKRTDGGRHTSYRERTYYQYSMLGSVSRYCDTLFVSNAKGIIQSWKTSGSCFKLD